MVPAKRFLAVRSFVIAAAVAAVVCLPHGAPRAIAQPPEQVAPGGIPVVPTQPPRPVEGRDAAQRWQLARPEKDNAPTASFIDSLKGTDASFQIAVGQGKVLTTKAPMEKGTVAVGDPNILDFDVLVPNTRMIRIIGKRPGITDLSITTSDGQVYSFQVQVVYDLEVLSAQLRQFFPDARIKLGQVRQNVIVEGEARSSAQVAQILQVIEKVTSGVNSTSSSSNTPPPPTPGGDNGSPAATGSSGSSQSSGGGLDGRIINLLRVPGPQQVMLQVRVAELNRTGLREIGADLAYVNPKNGTIAATAISNASVDPSSMLSAIPFSPGPKTTAFGIFPSSDFAIFLRALRENSLLTILAEPNLVAMNGHRASFLAGGQFPVPVPQGGGGATNNVTVEFKDFGVQLDFVPVILEDGAIRLEVTPEVSSIDFSLGTTLVLGGSPVPGLNTRRATTTVEIREGETLAIAGLLQVQIDAKTDRIPGLGDLPYIGPMFSNTTHQRQEKELLILVSPQLVSSVPSDQIGPSPGMDIKDPTNLEFYLMNRIEGRTGRPYRSTTTWDDGQAWMLRLEHTNACGPVGFSE